jgi:hypothetical protein
MTDQPITVEAVIFALGNEPKGDYLTAQRVIEADRRALEDQGYVLVKIEDLQHVAETCMDGADSSILRYI